MVFMMGLIYKSVLIATGSGLITASLYPNILAATPIILAIGGGIYFLGRMSQKISNIESRLDRISEKIDKIR